MRVSLLLALAVVVPAAAHDVYIGAARAVYREARGQLEVEVRLDASDVQTALTRFAKRRVDIDTMPTKDLDALLTKYFRARFSLVDGTGEARALSWIGHKVERVHDFWCFFRVPLPRGLQGAKVTLTPLVACFPRQMTLARFEWGKRSVHHRFTKTSRTVTTRFSD